MSVRTAYAGTALAGDVYTAANHARMPGGWIGYSLKTADQTISTTEIDVTDLSVTVTVNADRLIRVSALTIGDVGFNAWINEDGSHAGPPMTLSRNTTSVLLEPASGSHTYKITAQRSGAVDVTLDASATAPLYILVEDLGPAPS